MHTNRPLATVPDSDTARKKLLQALTRRSLTLAEATRKLSEWGVAEATAKAILNDFERAGYLDDRRFAEHFAHARLAKGYGWNRIRQEMAQRKVPTSLIAEAVRNETAALESDPSIDLFQATAEKEWRKLAKDDSETRQRRWLGRMQRRGFPLERILKVLRALERQENKNDRRSNQSE